MALEQLSRPAGPIVYRKQQRTQRLCWKRDEGHGSGCRCQRHDILVQRWGRVLEFKDPKGRQSLSQKWWQGVVQEAGYRYEVIRSVEDFQRVLAECG